MKPSLRFDTANAANVATPSIRIDQGRMLGPLASNHWAISHGNTRPPSPEAPTNQAVALPVIRMRRSR